MVTVSDGGPERKRAVVLVGSPAAPYSRSIRIARALVAEGFDVEIAAVAASGLPAEERLGPGVVLRRYAASGPWAVLGRSEGATATVVHGRSTAPTMVRRGLAALVRPVLVLRRWLFWPHTVRGWWSTLARTLAPADLYHACGALTIAPALAARDRLRSGPAGHPIRVLYDAIDDALSGNAASEWPAFIRAWHRRRETAWARAADATITVNDALARRLAERWRRAEPPTVVPNYPEPPAAGLIEAPPDRIRERIGAPASRRIVLFQGRLGPGLGLDEAADAVLLVPETTLVLLGFGRGFAASAARDRDPRYAGRHVTLPAVPPDELLPWTASADVAIVPLPPTSENQRLATPNKFWEAIAVGTPVIVVRGLVELERLVDEHGLGAVAASGSAADLATALRSVLDRPAAERAAERRRIAALAAARFSWPAAAERYRAVVRRLDALG